MGSRCHYPFSDRGGVRAHLRLPSKAASQALHCQQIPVPASAEFLAIATETNFETSERGNPMKRISILALMLFVISGLPARAQQTKDKEAARGRKSVYYDTFNQKWLDPAKWLANDPQCWGTLECVREIQDGHLRLALRAFGAADSDAGDQWAESGLYFVDPNNVATITADVTVRHFDGFGCPTNLDTPWIPDTQVRMGGNFFNTGTSDPADDVLAVLILRTDIQNPRNVTVAIWIGSGRGQIAYTEGGSYTTGTLLTATFAWDKANHQFVALVKAKGDTGPGVQVVLPYSESDTALPSNPYKNLNAFVEALNCTSGKSSARVEAFFDNAIINEPVPPIQ